MADINPGDEVRVIEGRRYGSSRIWTGRIAKVARKYAAVEYETTSTDWNGTPKREKRTVEFDMATGWKRGTYGTYGIRVRTPAQLEEQERRAGALAAIRAHGVEFKSGRERDLSLDQIEALAEVVKSWEA